MKKLLLVVACMAGLLTGAQGQKKELMDKIVATVGDEYILLSDIEEQYSASKDQKAVLPENYKCTIVDNALVSKLLVNQAKIDSVLVKDEEVEAQLAIRFERIMEAMGGSRDQFEAYYGQSPEEMKKQIREDMQSQLVADKMRNKIIADVSITPKEVKAFFDKIPKDSLPYFNQEVEISEVVYKPKVNILERQKALDKITDLRKRIVDGKEDFAALAKKNSADLGSGAQGGDLGWAKRGKFVAEFEAAAYKLDAKEITQPIETDFGFHIIQLLERRGNTIHARHILIRPEITLEDLNLAKHILDSIRALVIKDSMKFSYAVKAYGDKNQQSFNNDGRLTNPASGNSIFETKDLDPDIYFVVDTMKVGGVSKPIEITGPTGDKLYRLVRLLSKTSPHKANLGQDYSKIQVAALDQKKNEYLIKWLTDHASNTFINIDPIYGSCASLSKWKGKKGKGIKP